MDIHMGQQLILEFFDDLLPPLMDLDFYIDCVSVTRQDKLLWGNFQGFIANPDYLLINWAQAILNYTFFVHVV